MDLFRCYVVAIVLAVGSLADAQSVLHQPFDAFDFEPRRVAASPDGTLYVADEVSRTIQHFSSDGKLLSVFDSPASPNYDLTGLAVDSEGTIHTTWSFAAYSYYQAGNTKSGYAQLSPTGETLVRRDFNRHGLSGVAVGGDDQVYVVGPELLARVDDGTLATLAEPGFERFRGLDIGPDNNIYVHTDGYRRHSIGVYTTTGELTDTFSISNPALPNAKITGFAVTPSGVYVHNEFSGTVRRYSTTGEFAGVGYGLPRVGGFGEAADGSLLAAFPHNRVVERIGEERFDADYAGVTLLTESSRRYVTGPYPFWNNGMDVSDGWVESPASTFRIPGTPGELVEVGFRYVESGNSVLSVFPVAAVTADPIAEPMEYMRQAMEHSLTHLDMSNAGRCVVLQGGCGKDDPALFETLTVEAGTEIGFLHLRNRWSYPQIGSYPGYGSGNWISTLGPRILDRAKQDALDTFEALGQASEDEFAQVMTRHLDDPLRSLNSLLPFASDARANWGRLDQFSFFLSDDSTFLVMEDLSMAGFSDLSYNDATLLIDLRLIPVPEPHAAWLVGVALAGGSGLRPSRRVA